LVSVAVKMFTYLIYFVKFYKFWALNDICKDNAAIYGITFPTKEMFITVNFDGLYTKSVWIIKENNRVRRNRRRVNKEQMK
jgi:hypothetical protein